MNVAVNLNGVTDTNTLVTAINQAIQNAGNGSSQQDTAFKNANITASVITNASGQQTLAFSSATTAFQVQGGDQVATALMGNFASGAQGNVANVTAAAATAFAAPTGNAMATAGQAYAAPVAAEVVNMQVTGNGLTGTAGEFTVTLPTTVTTADEAVTAINAGIAANTALAATGLQAVNNSGTARTYQHYGRQFQRSSRRRRFERARFRKLVKQRRRGGRSRQLQLHLAHGNSRGDCHHPGCPGIPERRQHNRPGYADGNHHLGHQSGHLERGLPGQRGHRSRHAAVASGADIKFPPPAARTSA